MCLPANAGDTKIGEYGSWSKINNMAAVYTKIPSGHTSNIARGGVHGGWNETTAEIFGMKPPLKDMLQIMYLN
jgi:hypothetical protein